MQIRPTLAAGLVALGAMAAPLAAKDKAGFDAEKYEIFRQAFAETCMFEGDFMPPPEERVEVFEFTFQRDWEGAEPETVTVHQFHCFSGAYNIVSVFFIDDRIEGFRPLPFAEPELDIVHADPDDPDSAVESVGIAGYTATLQLVNASVDVDSGTISSHARWRGIGDASSSAVYHHTEGRFALRFYAVDASYDGEINPETLIDLQGD
jgi:hypothetical protein